MSRVRVKSLKRLRQQRCRAADEKPDSVTEFPGEFRSIHQPCIKGGDPHHDRDRWQVSDDLLCIEARQEVHRNTAQHCAMDRHEQAMHVVDRQGME